MPSGCFVDWNRQRRSNVWVNWALLIHRCPWCGRDQTSPTDSHLTASPSMRCSCNLSLRGSMQNQAGCPADMTSSWSVLKTFREAASDLTPCEKTSSLRTIITHYPSFMTNDYIQFAFGMKETTTTQVRSFRGSTALCEMSGAASNSWIFRFHKLRWLRISS